MVAKAPTPKPKTPNSVFPMIAVVVLVATTILLSVVIQFTAYVDSMIETNLDRAVTKLNSEIDNIKVYANVVSLFLAQDDDVICSLRDGDRQTLIDRMEYLNEDLGIDVYIITDADGIVVLQSASNDVYGFDVSAEPSINAALSGRHVVSFERGAGLNVQVVSGTAVSVEDEIVGVVFIGFNIGTEVFLDALSFVSGTDFLLYVSNTAAMSTIIDEDGSRVMVEAPDDIYERIMGGETIRGRFTLLDRNIIGLYAPLTAIDGRIIGMILIWEFLDERQSVVYNFILSGALITVLVLGVSVVIIVQRTERIDIELRAREDQILSRDFLLRTVNSMTARFLRSDEDSFEDDMRKSMSRIGEALDVDRVYVFRNYMKEGKLYSSQVYEWSENVPSQSDNEYTSDFSYSDLSPDALEMFNNDQCLNGIVDNMSDSLQMILKSQGIVSILLAPVFMQGNLWGFVGIDDCFDERVFTFNEEMAMRSASFAMVSALIRYEQIVRIRNYKELELQLTEANKAKSKFLAHMSHEIRTPLNGIIGFADLAMELSPDSKMKQHLENIQENGALLMIIVNDILDIAKVESGKMKLENMAFSLSELLNHAYMALESKAKKRGLLYAVHADDKVLEKRLIGDPTRLLQVLLNLLSNAVKFTQDGSIDLTVSCLSYSAGVAELHFEVKDTGIGMTQDQLSRVMTPFMQADDSVTRMFGGTGLGLAICKELLKLMGGDITIESSPNMGTKISFTLRFPVAAEEDFKPIDEDLEKNNPVPIFEAEVLLCEDNEMNRQVMVEHLNRIGVMVATAENGADGVFQIRKRIESGEKMFDLVFMDINMPVMGGLEAARTIKELGLTVPIIAVTANVMTTDYELYKSAGMDTYLGKPFRSSDLRDCLMSFIEPVGYRDALHDDRSDLGETHATEKVGTAYDGYSEDFVKKMNKMFVKGNVSTIENINEAIRTGKIEEAHRIAHTLKSNAAMIKRDSLRDIAAKIEAGLENNENNTNPNLLKTLAYELKLVLHELEEAPPKATAAKTESNPAEILMMLDALEPLLESYDTESLSMLDRLWGIEALKELADQIESFDFSNAQKTLLELRAQYVDLV